MRDRVKTGIAGLDKMLYGGIPEKNQIVLAGGPGTGKTLMSIEYLYKNAKDGNVGVLFSLEEERTMIIDNALAAFSSLPDMKQLIDDNKLIIHGSEETRGFIQKDAQGSSYTFGRLVTEIESILESTGANRVVIDSISIIKLLIKDMFEYRNISMSLVSVLRRMNTTAILTMEIESPERSRMLFQPEFFIYDGIVILYTGEGQGGSLRTPTLEVIKMRGTNHSFSTVPYEITPEGINILLLAEKEEYDRI